MPAAACPTNPTNLTLHAHRTLSPRRRVSLHITGNITLLTTGDGLQVIGVFASPTQQPAYVVLAQVYYILNGERRSALEGG